MMMLKKPLGLVALGWLGFLLPIPFVSFFTGLGFTISGLFVLVQSKETSLSFLKRMALAVAILIASVVVYVAGIYVMGAVQPKPELRQLHEGMPPVAVPR